VVEICEMGTASTGSAAVKKLVVAHVYTCTRQKTHKIILSGADRAMRGADAYRDENGVDGCEKGEVGYVSRQEIM